MKKEDSNFILASYELDMASLIKVANVFGSGATSRLEEHDNTFPSRIKKRCAWHRY